MDTVFDNGIIRHLLRHPDGFSWTLTVLPCVHGAPLVDLRIRGSSGYGNRARRVDETRTVDAAQLATEIKALTHAVTALLGEHKATAPLSAEHVGVEATLRAKEEQLEALDEQMRDLSRQRGKIVAHIAKLRTALTSPLTLLAHQALRVMRREPQRTWESQHVAAEIGIDDFAAVSRAVRRLQAEGAVDRVGTRGRYRVVA